MARALIATCAALLFAAAVPGCFHPDKPSCAFSCVEPPHTCPSGFMCGADGLCHDPTSARVCTIDLVDAATADADGAASSQDATTSPDTLLDSATDRGQ
jgi:hypothetical protein